MFAENLTTEGSLLALKAIKNTTELKELSFNSSFRQRTTILQ